MNIIKYLFAILAMSIFQPAAAIAAQEKIYVPSEAHIATCLTLMTVNDHWHDLTFDINRNDDAKALVKPFENKLVESMEKTCSFLFGDWSSAERELMNDRINAVCTDDANRANPYLVNSLHCKQARAN